MRIVTLPGVFAPHSDSRLLAAHVAAAAAARPGATLLDPFAGTGIVAIAGARAGARTTAVDVSRRAIACVHLNAALNRVAVRARRGDLFAPVRGETFDLIAANPPYLPALDGEPARGRARAWDAGRDGRALIDRLCREAPRHLRPGGMLVVVHSSVCDPEATLALLARRGLEPEVVERRRGPLGPLLAARAAVLERRGLLAPGERHEELAVVAARRPGRSRR